jgi:hypothetical protein
MKRKMPKGVRSKRPKRLRCEFCDILIGEGFIYTEPYKMVVYRKPRILCKLCYEDLNKINEPERSKYFKEHRLI